MTGPRIYYILYMYLLIAKQFLRVLCHPPRVKLPVVCIPRDNAIYYFHYEYPNK